MDFFLLKPGWTTLEPPGFSIRQDRSPDTTGKRQGGGVCFLINNSWCNDVKIWYSSCEPDLEQIAIRCRPYYLPREFIPPSHRRRGATAVLVRHKPQWHRHDRRGSAVDPSLIAVAPRKTIKTADLGGGTA